MNKLLILVLVAVLPLMAVAQSADERIGKLMNEGRWFELEREMRDTAVRNSLHPMICGMAESLVCHYFNRPDSAVSSLNRLLGQYQAQMGDNTLSMAYLLGVDLSRSGHYGEAADLLQSLVDQMVAQGAGDTDFVKGVQPLVGVYVEYDSIGGICRPLHPVGEYCIPMLADNSMHSATGDTVAHSIRVAVKINGVADTCIFDTGAGVNVIPEELAGKFGLRPLKSSFVMQGIGMSQGQIMIADTVRIGGMAWANVPFVVADFVTGHSEADKVAGMMPPVIGLPIMLSMGEMQFDFDGGELVVPEKPTPNPLGSCNLMRTDSENLQILAEDEDGTPLLMHFDTGTYYTVMSPKYYDGNKTAVEAVGQMDSLRMAGMGGVSITRSYRLPRKCFEIGGSVACLDSVTVNTGIDKMGNKVPAQASEYGGADGTVGLDLLERFGRVIVNLREMYIIRNSFVF